MLVTDRIIFQRKQLGRVALLEFGVIYGLVHLIARQASSGVVGSVISLPSRIRHGLSRIFGMKGLTMVAKNLEINRTQWISSTADSNTRH